MCDILLKLILVFLVFALPLLVGWGMYKLVQESDRKEWRKKFDSIQKGDKFIQKLNQPDPFKKQYSQIVEIVEKATTSDGGMYLLYKIESTVDIEESCSVQDFLDLYHYEPYNNQDKQS